MKSKEEELEEEGSGGVVRSRSEYEREEGSEKRSEQEE